MGIYLRKSVRVGPFRFNLSKSGIGVSAGIPGFRVGTGPRGNYIHMGRGGLYYRKTLPKKSGELPVSPVTDRNNSESYLAPQTPDNTHDPLKEIESGDISGMVDSSSEDLVKELNQKRKKIRMLPFALILGGSITGYLVFQNFDDLYIYASAVLTVLGIAAAGYRDTLCKSVVMLYDIEDEFQDIYKSLHDAFEQMAKCKGRWHMEAEGRVKDKKYHAGADSIVRRKSISLSLNNPPHVKTNIATPTIPVGKQNLFFFPDMVLIFDSNGVGAVSYENLSVEVCTQKFIEEDSVPSDAKVVDHTWKYVNKRGGPDKRFKDNRKIPIALYEDVYFSSTTGLNERIELSKAGVAEPFAAAIRNVGDSNTTYG